MFTFRHFAVVTVLSKAIIRMPRAAPWLMMPFSPVGEAALMMIASGFCEIRLDNCWDCLLTSLSALKTLPSTSDLKGSIPRAALKTFSISSRHLLPM